MFVFFLIYFLNKAIILLVFKNLFQILAAFFSYLKNFKFICLVFFKKSFKQAFLNIVFKKIAFFLKKHKKKFQLSFNFKFITFKNINY